MWISDQDGRRLFIWVTYSLDGRFAYSHAPEIFDVARSRSSGVRSLPAQYRLDSDRRARFEREGA